MKKLSVKVEGKHVVCCGILITLLDDEGRIVRRFVSEWNEVLGLKEGDEPYLYRDAYRVLEGLIYNAIGKGEWYAEWCRKQDERDMEIVPKLMALAVEIEELFKE